MRYDQLRRRFPVAQLERGEQMFRQGRVSGLERPAPTVIAGQVKGGSGSTWQVELELVLRQDGGVHSFDGRCGCRTTSPCRHQVALLRAAGVISAGVNAKATGAKSAAMVDWLWPGDEREVAPRRTGPLTPGQDHLFYVFRPDATRGMRVLPVRAHLWKSGNIGRQSPLHQLHGFWGQHHLTLQDAALVGQLMLACPPEVADPPAWPRGEALVDLLRSVVDTGRARLGAADGVAMSWAPPRKCSLNWEPVGDGTQRIMASDGTADPLQLLPFPTPLVANAATGETGIADLALPSDLAGWLVAAPPVPREAVHEVQARLARVGRRKKLPPLRDMTEVPGGTPTPVLSLRGYPREDGAGGETDERKFKAVVPAVKLEFVYPGVEGRLRIGGEATVPGERKGRGVLIRRDIAGERSCRAELRWRAKRHRGGPPADWEVYRVPEAAKEADILFSVPYPGHGQATDGLNFWLREANELSEQGWVVEVDPSWPFQLHGGPVSYAASLEPEAETDWFSLRLAMTVDGKVVDIAGAVQELVKSLPVDASGGLPEDFDVAAHLERRTLRIRLGDRSWTLLPGRQLAGFAEAFLEAQGLLRFHRVEAERLLTLAEALGGCGAPWTGSRQLLDLGARLRSRTEGGEVEPPAALRGVLRPYQQVGYGWLRGLAEVGLGGVLADDMGLGKTVQALALLAHRHLEAKADRPSLLVVQTSLVGNWRREAARFVPGLRLLVLHGPDRHDRFDDIAHTDLVVTTYPLINRDHERLFGQPWDTVVLDEAQTVKNPAAAVSRHIRAVRARHRIALTGTPLENSLMELWALYDFLIPGLLGNRREFGARFRKPIEKKGDRAAQRALSARVRPFLLRRSKEEVEADLPAKTVIDEPVALEGAQAALYESIRSAMDARVRKAIAERGLAGSRITILDALLKLRQACCDPQLVKLAAARKVTASGKRERLLALLEELVAEQRRVLVFSQFVEMLRLIEADIQARGWDYALLHGRTRDRDGQVERFQSGQVPIFLVSLKAGGTGLNLTAADTVIIYDPWWNPAVERQAMDRAHRIGQDKPVFVYRMVAENTVETAIQQMQARKQALADALFEGTGSAAARLTEADVAELFAAADGAGAA